FFPREHADHAQIQRHINDADQNNGKKERTRDRPLGILYLASEETNIVVTPIVVGRKDERGAESEKEVAVEGECVRRKSEDLVRADVRESADDHPRECGHDSSPQHSGYSADGADA